MPFEENFLKNTITANKLIFIRHCERNQENENE